MDILPQLLLNSLIAGSIYALTSSGLSLVYGLNRVLNFAHGHFMMVGAYFFYEANAQFGLGAVESFLIAALVMAVLSALSFEIFISPFVGFSYFLPFVTTLALATILESIVSMVWGVNVKSLSTGYSIESFEIYGVYITPVQIFIIISAIILLSLVAFIVHSTSLGRKVRALSQHEYAAESLGVSKRKVSYIIFIIGALMAAYAGVLIGFETNIQPTMGNAYTIKAFAAMILGGLGNFWGTIFGSYILGLIENLSIGLDLGDYSIPAGYKDAFAFLIILIVLLFKPQGLFNRKSRVA
ncbi:MAG: branched-chain amino acid ABC transporter permease [Bdellovibrionales bacterium]|nr:branched-chain amino acid ABC transporter permease [Bdellovibrionales bacterium]